MKTIQCFLLLTWCHSQPLVTFGHSRLEMAPRERHKSFHFLHTSDGKQILISLQKAWFYNRVQKMGLWSGTLQVYGYNFNWRGWGTSQYCFTQNRPFHWSLISTGEVMLTGLRVLCFDPVKIPSPVQIRDQWDGLFGVKRYIFWCDPSPPIEVITIAL